jgi:hypothetical protein
MGKLTQSKSVFHVCPSCGRTDAQSVPAHLFDSLSASAIEAMYLGGKSQYTISNEGLEKEVVCDDCLALQDNTWDDYLASEEFRLSCGLAAASEQ